VEVFHSQIPHSKQEEISASLLTSDGTVKIVIATSALSMGFDAKGTYFYWTGHLRLETRFKKRMTIF